MQNETTDINFMPFRLRYRSACITSYHHVSTLNMSACINYKHNGNFMEMYDDRQAFYFYPLLSYPHKIYQYTLHPNEQKRCMTVQVPKYMTESTELLTGISLTSISDMIFNVSMESCDLTDDRGETSIQKFTFHILRNPRLNAFNQGQYYTYLKPLSQLHIQWHWKHESTGIKYSFCMSFPSYAANDVSQIIQLVPCNLNKLSSDLIIRRGINDTTPLQSIILERTRVIGPPLRPGIVIGDFAIWNR